MLQLCRNIAVPESIIHMKTSRICFTTLRWIAAGLMTGAASHGLAQQAQTLYATPGTPSWRDNYTGGSGCQFTVGSSNVVVSHLGYFSTNTVTGLNSNHYVGIFNSSKQLVAQVIVPAGTGADYYTNDFYWMPLDPPFLLSSNTVYYVAALPYNGDGDFWGDSFSPTWNSFFIGSQATTTRHTAYGPGVATWPPSTFSTFGNNSTYCVEGMGNLPIDQARVGVQNTNLAYSSGQTVTIVGFASGQPPINYQWWEAPNTPLANQTNAILTIPSASTSASGTYYLTASNALGGEQSPNVTVSVTAYPVGFSQQPTNTSVFANYPVTFSCVATGTPPISLQWSRNSVQIPGATSSSLSFFTSATNNGDVYSCFGSNYIINPPASYTATSSNATLTVLANAAFPQELLHGDKTGLANNTYQGQQGGEIVIGNTPVLVTHLGYYAWPTNRVTNGSSVTITYSTDHHVGIYYASGINAGQYVPTNNLIGSVDVPASNALPVINGYAWEPLNPPLVLSNNTTYLLVAETKSDALWGDTYGVTDLNPYFTTQCFAIYGGNAWGTPAYLGGRYSGQMYSAPNMAILALTNLSAYVAPASITQAAGTSASLTAFAEGQAPVTLQWYKDGNALPGQTATNLTLPFLQNSDAGNYYVIATNTATSASATSAVSSVTVLSTNEPLALFVGGQATLSVPLLGGATYQWFDGGTAISGANSASYLLAASSAGSTSFYCVVTNGATVETNAVWNVTILAAPTAPYPAAVLAANPMGYWRLNETNGGGNTDVSGEIANDYWRGNNGIYSNADLGMVGYNTTTDPTETGAQFGIDTFTDGGVYGIGEIDFSAPSNNSVAFSIEAWVNGAGQTTDAGLVSKGYGGGGEQFSLDTGAPTNVTQTLPHNFRFLVRDASGTVHSASSSIQPGGVWHHLVGVCDEAHSNVTLYVDGAVAASTSITPGSGILSSARQMLIGSRPSSAQTDNNLQFVGTMDDVAVYNYALSASNVDYQYSQSGVAPNFTQSPPASVNTNDGATVTLPAILVGTPPMGYYWANVNYGTNVATGSTNGDLLNATLTVQMPLAWNGNTLQLTVTNAYGTTLYSVAVTIYANAPQITQDIQPQAVYEYQPAQFTVGASGSAPLSYQWTFNGSLIAGATNSTLDLSGVTSANAGNYEAFVTNSAGTTNSSVAALTVIVPPANTYEGAAMSPNLLLYYSFEDAASGFGIATNQGSLGFAYNGTYEGGYSSVAGPTGFSNFDPTNQAVALDGFSADVSVPSVSMSLSNCTIAAWVYSGGGQSDNTAIFFHRQSSVFGLAIGNNIFGAANWLKYTWNDDPSTYNAYSGLVLPTNQWAFVALVMNSTNAALYLQDGVSMHSTNFPGTYLPQDFSGVSYVGWDTAGGAGGRRWTGDIDDVMVFDQALSPAAINALYAGVPASVVLNISKSSGNIVLSWPLGTLEEATNLTGPWVTNSAASPYTNTPNGPAKFYRVQVR